MIIRTLAEIVEMCGGTNLNPNERNILIKGVSIDTRSIEPNNLFIPIKGERFNGHQFLEQAIANGAVAALWNRDEPKPEIEFPIIYVEDTLTALQQLAGTYRKQIRCTVIGITGSNGKTSTKDILASLLATQYKTQKTFGNLNNHLGVPLTLLEVEEDTEMVVVEMGMSDLGEIELLSSIAQPDIGVITNIGEAHLEHLKTRENIVKAKLEILSGLSENGLLVFYGDEPLLRKGLDSLPQGTLAQVKVISYGGNFVSSIISNKHGVYFTLAHEDLHLSEKSSVLFLPMLGKHQVLNSIGAISVARYLGISFTNIKKGLRFVEATGMRNELIQTDKLTIINDTYKSNPTSLKAALATLYDFQKYQQKIVVLGDMNGMGEDEIIMHREIGELIDPQQINYLFTLGSKAEHMAQVAEKRFPQGTVFAFLNKEELISQLQNVLVEDTIILIKGSRELEMEEVVVALQREELKTSTLN